MSEEPLVHVPLESWTELQNVFKVDWPRSICGYMVLDVQRDLIQNGLDYGFKVYCPFGDFRNGMVAVNIKDQLYEIIIQCPQEDTGKLEDALRRTKIVNWQRSVILPFTEYHVIECLRRVLGHQVKVELLPVEKFIFDKPEIGDDIKLPQGISFELIKLEHLELVDTTWPHRYPTSKWYFRLLINAEFGYGLYEANELISWVFYDESGELLHLHTVEDHRRKGYAELLVRLIRNVLIKKGKPIIAFCVTDNFNAYKLFNKLNFTKLEPVAWCYLNKGKD